MHSKIMIHLTCECILANSHINHNVLAISFVISFQFFLQRLCILYLVLLIFCYSAQIMLENALFCWQNARLKNRLFLLKILPAEFIQA